MAKGAKPNKPNKDFPLSPANNGQWQKKVRGKVHYFGVWAEPQAALEEWLRQKDDLLAGRTPTRAGTEITVLEVFDQFLESRKQAVGQGTMTLRSFVEYKRVLAVATRELGRTRPFGQLQPVDFRNLKAVLAKGKTKVLKPEVVGRAIQSVRTAVKWAFDSDLVAQPIKMGPEFCKPGARVLHRLKADAPAKLISPVTFRRLLVGTHKWDRYQLRAMLWLGLNAAYGNTDCSELREADLDLDKGILDDRRSKTGGQRRCTLWPETIEALREVLARRPKAADKADADRVFLIETGRPWVQYVADTEAGTSKVLDYVSESFNKLARGVGVKQAGVTFYALRHTFKTIGDGTGILPAVERIMGHFDKGMSAIYHEWERGGAHDEMLRRVTDHVRQWYLDGIKGEVAAEEQAAADKREEYLAAERARDKARRADGKYREANRERMKRARAAQRVA